MFKKRPLTLFEKLPLFFRALVAPDTSWPLRGVILLTIGYIILPTDLLPDFLGPFAWLDDLLIAHWAINQVIQRLPVSVKS